MANIIDNLNILDQKLDTAKTTLANNLTAKGVPSTTGDTLTAMADKVAEISGGGGSGDLDWSAIGYNKRPEAIDNGYNYAKEIYDTWDASQTDLTNKFLDDKKLVYFPAVDTSKATNMEQMLNFCTSLTSVPELNTSKVTNMSRMFAYCSSLTTIPAMDTQNVTDMGTMFTNCTSLTSVLELNTSKVTNMNGLFDNCQLLTTIPAMDTQNVTDMGAMFNNCTSLTSVPELNTSKVTNMNNMFANCQLLTTIPAMDTQNVTNMGYMFQSCYSLTTIPAMDTQNVTDMDSMFNSCTSLTSVPELNTQNVTTMGDMFANCLKLRFVNIINLGAKTEITNIDFMGYSWDSNKLIGIDGDGVTGCKQALVDTLLTNSFDRATAGYPVCTIKLAPESKAVLTAEEISAIEAKGYTIVTE